MHETATDARSVAVSFLFYCSLGSTFDGQFVSSSASYSECTSQRHTSRADILPVCVGVLITPLAHVLCYNCYRGEVPVYLAHPLPRSLRMGHLCFCWSGRENNYV